MLIGLLCVNNTSSGRVEEESTSASCSDIKWRGAPETLTRLFNDDDLIIRHVLFLPGVFIIDCIKLLTPLISLSTVPGEWQIDFLFHAFSK